jgi:transcriptional regulator with XRE-family HTH domain
MHAHPSVFLDLDMADFAQRLRELRTQRNLTQARVAELVGVGLRVYHRWERGGAAPHFETLLKLADVLGVSLDELAGRKHAPDDARIKNPELHQLVRDVDQLPDEEQQALILVIDSMVKRAKINRMATPSPRKRATSSARAGR